MTADPEDGDGERSTPASPTRIAVVDDDVAVRRLINLWLRRSGYESIEFASGRAALEMETDALAAVCLDLHLGDDVPGQTVLAHLRARDPELPVIVVTAEKEVDTAVSAMRGGAYDYLVKPLDSERLLAALSRAVERRALSQRVWRLQQELRQRGDGASRLVGDSAPMRELSRQIERVQGSDVAVCVRGESGTGKELVARAIHDGGRRRAGPFVAINCAAIPPTLQESELFGHERGAFTGAVGLHKGRFEQAHGGTLFLDEIGEMTPATQASLLRTLQEKVIRRVGGTAEIPVNVRVVSATHRDLEAEVAAGRFRQDLYFRLMVYPIHLPPLRERLGDIPQLVAHFLRKLGSDGARVRRVHPDVWDALSRHLWPGNVRELENVVHRAVLACEGEELELAHLPADLRDRVLPPVPGPGAAPAAKAQPGDDEILPLKELERRAIDRALAATGGNIARAAKLLGVGRATLYRKLGATPEGEGE